MLIDIGALDLMLDVGWNGMVVSTGWATWLLLGIIGPAIGYLMPQYLTSRSKRKVGTYQCYVCCRLHDANSVSIINGLAYCIDCLESSAYTL